MASRIPIRPFAGCRLTFGADWRVTQSAPLVSGQPMEIQYAAERLHRAVGGVAGLGERQGWTITGYLTVDGGPPRTFCAASPSISGAVRVVPDAARLGHGTLVLWFEVHDIYGWIHYDSDYGRNYHFKIYPRVVFAHLPAAKLLGRGALARR